MGMTATQLGRLFFDRAPAEMNRLLQEHGFIEGGAGAWRPTELGKAFARTVDKDNGYGGFAARQWSWLTWDDGLVDALKESMKSNPNGIAPTVPSPAAVVTTVTGNGTGSPGDITGGFTGGVTGAGKFLSKHPWLAAAAVAGSLMTTPPARRAWHERVKPAASRARARITNRGAADQTNLVNGDERREPGAEPDPGT